ncbi:MAG TPA: HEPN domain-containing protein [Candidatus Nanoarchaeia archaeon]|nr:HEPN domain-containing protein [Candidatus Nanoarchaeia archaeon]
MKIEAKRWLQQAKEDLDSAEFNFHGNRYNVASFLCQQTAEKALKALLIQKTGSFPKIHDLTRLAKLTNSPKKILERCAAINPAYILSRYPDSPQSYSHQDCIKSLSYTKEVLEWAQKKLK